MHARSVVVWDVPEAIECGRPFSIRLGIRCESACPPDAWQIEVHDAAGTVLAATAVSGDPWPGTEALYPATAELVSPDTEGLSVWRAVARGTVSDPVGAAEHAEAHSGFNVRTVAAADFRLTVVAVDRESQSPLAGARVVVHPFRMRTDARGIAELPLPRGPYRLFVTERDFFPFRSDGELESDLTVRVELCPDPGPSDAESWS